MKLVNESFEVITMDEVDLTKGYLTTVTLIRDDAEPIDDITKFAWDDTDYEEAQQYRLYKERPPEPTPSNEERIAELEAALDLLLGVNDDE